MRNKILYLNLFFTIIIFNCCNKYEYLDIPKDLEKIEFEPANLDKLNGTYLSARLEGNSCFGFTLGKSAKEEAFFFDYEDGNREINTAKLERKFTDKEKGQMVFLITKASGYYTKRKGQYLTIYAKNISNDGNTCQLAIATRTGSFSIASSKGDVLSSTLEDAKKLYPPPKSSVFKNYMMAYAYMWINTTRENK